MVERGEDYDCGYVEKYNSELHRVDPNSFGTLYFIRLRGQAENS